ncbi:MAG: 30S ribosome-binding factor RbfA [bacterium]
MHKSHTYKRSERVAELIHKEISNILILDIKDPRVKDAVITHIYLSDDLKHAKIYISVLGDEQKKTSTLAGLNNAKGFIRKVLGSRLRLRNIPELEFILDDSIEYGSHISELLQKIKNNEPDNPNT